MLTPPQIAKRLGVNPDKVLTWIRNGELEAFNAATRPDSQRPRYRVTEEALLAFQARRAVGPQKPIARRRKKATLSESELIAKIERLSKL
jgi:excisionase family DNA binding protein